MKYLILLLVTLLSTQAQAMTIEVTNTNNTGPGSLRDAINISNNNGLPDYIVFNIPGLGPHVIAPMSGLPPITEAVHIKGYTQLGSAIATDTTPAIINIVLDGSLADINTSGLIVSDNHVRIQGLAIRNFKHDGLRLIGNNNLVWGSYIGTDNQGLESQPNLHSGIFIQGDFNQVGGSSAAARTIISGKSQQGINVHGNSNRILGSYIGTDVTTSLGIGSKGPGILINGDNNSVGWRKRGGGNVIAANKMGIYIQSGQLNQVFNNIIGTDKSTALTEGLGNNTGVLVEGIGNGHNEIGGVNPFSGNVISNNYHGLLLNNDSNVVQGNYIGTDVSTNMARGNHHSGVRVSGSNNWVGGSLHGARNVIAANGVGINIDDGINNQIQGNIIGTNLTASSTDFLGNGTGIIISGDNGGSNLVGGAGPRKGNLISNNSSFGIIIRSNGNKVQGNRIGTDPTGGQAMGNGRSGVLIDSGETNTIGGLTESARNIISANQYGITINSNNNVVQGNRIGTDATGTQPLGNTQSGVFLNGSGSNTVGGPEKAARNIISANHADGILIATNFLHPSGGVSDTFGNIITNNFIGTDFQGNNSIGNVGSGIKITGGYGNQIGGADRTEGNLISGNREHGIWLGSLTDGWEFSSFSATFIINNTIGSSLNRLAPLPNNGSGIYINSTEVDINATKIGGMNGDLENFIAWNGGDGITLVTGRETSILRNTIISNNDKAIDLNADGISFNDLFDYDAGANGTQNYPVINSVIPEGSGYRVHALLQTEPFGRSRVEFYSTNNCDADYQGQGERFLGSLNTAESNSAGLLEFSFLITETIPQGHSLTATGTRIAGAAFPGALKDTSEFSDCVPI